jgi:hypothetical protein
VGKLNRQPNPTKLMFLPSPAFVGAGASGDDARAGAGGAGCFGGRRGSLGMIRCRYRERIGERRLRRHKNSGANLRNLHAITHASGISAAFP